MEFKVELTKQKKQKPTGKLTFGTTFTDHMFVMQYDAGQGWHDARIQPYADFTMDPATIVYHYGQAIFEGLKAYKTPTGGVTMFRPRLNLERMNSSAERMCMPAIDVEFVLDALKKLVALEAEWIPAAEGTSLYIRPTMIATDVTLGVHASKSYLFYIILSPVGAYYENGLAPVSLKVEDKFVRAAKGGTGHYKFAGNYASSLLSSEVAEQEGFDQVMWLDAKDRRYIEEVGSMNIFFVIDGKVVTPELGGSILPGITRRSCIELLHTQGTDVEERLISIEELVAGVADGTLTEIFGTGTAAVISPVGTFSYQGEKYTVADGKMGKVAAHLYDTITGMQTAKIPDTLDWVTIVQE